MRGKKDLRAEKGEYGQNKASTRRSQPTMSQDLKSASDLALAYEYSNILAESSDEDDRCSCARCTRASPTPRRLTRGGRMPASAKHRAVDAAAEAVRDDAGDG